MVASPVEFMSVEGKTHKQAHEPAVTDYCTIETTSVGAGMGKVKQAYLASVRISCSVQPHVIDVRVCKFVRGGGEPNVDLLGKVDSLRVAFAMVGDHVANGFAHRAGVHKLVRINAGNRAACHVAHIVRTCKQTGLVFRIGH